MEPFFKLNEEHFAFHLHYKHFGTFANRKCEDVSYPQNRKMCDPILVTLLKMLPRYSQSSCENGTPSNGRCTLASYSMYKKVPPPGGGGGLTKQGHPASLLFKGQGTEQTTVKWPISQLQLKHVMPIVW